MTYCQLGDVWAEMGKSATRLASCPWLHHKPGTSPPRSTAPSGLGGSQPVDALRGFFSRMETWSGAGVGVGGSDSLGHSIHSFCLFWGQPETLGRIVTFVAWWPNREVILVLVITTNTFTKTFMQIFKTVNKNIENYSDAPFSNHSIILIFILLLKYILFTVFQVYSKEIQLYVYILFLIHFHLKVLTRYLT